MSNSEEDKRADFAARAFEHKGRAEAHRLQAEMAEDPKTKTIHADAAATYDSLALELDKTAKRIADIDRTTTKARAKISVLPKSQLSQDATPETAPEVQEPEHKA